MSIERLVEYMGSIDADYVYVGEVVSQHAAATE